MKFVTILSFLFVVYAVESNDDVWDKFLQEINPNGVVVADVTTPEPPVYDCDPPYQHHYVFNCNVEGKRSKERPTSAHHLMPGDIDIVGAMGDSITAANGAGACLLPGIAVEYRGISWSVGGDNNFEETLTIANIIKKYNPNVYGQSYGRGNVRQEDSVFNCAVPGAVSEDIYDQSQDLVRKMKADENVNLEEDWKLVTLFIGGNDLCASCRNLFHYSAEQYVEHIKKGIDYLYYELPRTVVNVIGILNVPELEKLNGTKCDSMHEILCSCAMFLEPKEKEAMYELARKYQILLEQLTKSYDTKEDFTVLYQPFFEETEMPVDENGNVDPTLWSPDCFHFSAKGHAYGTKEMWNNMMEPVNHKHKEWDQKSGLFCPSEDFPYIHTYVNQYGLPTIPGSGGTSLMNQSVAFMVILSLAFNYLASLRT